MALIEKYKRITLSATSKICALVIALAALDGCATKCASFNTAIMEWMPFKVGDEVTLQDSLATYTLAVTKSQVDHTVKVGKNTLCTCEDRYSVTLNTTWLNLDHFFHNSGEVENSDVVVNDEVLNFSEHLFNQNINGTSYSEVVIYRNYSPATAKFQEVVIARSVGPVRITGASAKWLRVNPGLLQPDPAKVAFNDFSCL